MSERYLLKCRCGEAVAVEQGQAGRTVRCACGNRLDVPTLRGLRNLPKAPASRAAAEPSSWSSRQRWIAIGILLVVIGVAIGLVAYWRRADSPLPAIRQQLHQQALRDREAIAQMGARDLVANYDQLVKNDLRTEANYHKRFQEWQEYEAAEQRYVLWLCLAAATASIGGVMIQVIRISSRRARLGFAESPKDRKRVDANRN